MRKMSHVSISMSLILIMSISGSQRLHRDILRKHTGIYYYDIFEQPCIKYQHFKSFEKYIYNFEKYM